MKRLFILMIVLAAGTVTYAAPPAPKDMTLEEFLQASKANDEAKGRVFNEAAYKAKFERLDVDKNGILTVQEQTPAPKQAK